MVVNNLLAILDPADGMCHVMLIVPIENRDLRSPFNL